MTNFKLLAIVFYALLGCQSLGAQTREVDYIVALVNSAPITRNDVLNRQTRLQAQWAAQGVNAPAPAEVFKRVLDQLIDEQVIAQIGRDSGARMTDTQLNDTLLDIARRNGLASLAALQSRYEADGGSWQAYREEIRDELLRQLVREREVDSRIRVTEAEIDQAMQPQNGAGAANVDINLAQILISLPDDPSPEAVAQAKLKAEQLAAQLRGGADFAKLAAEHSDASDKLRGGVMGLRAADRYPELFVEAIQAAKVGDVALPVRSGAGFHILKLLERASAATAKVTESQVRHILLPITAEQTESIAKARMLDYKSQIEQGKSTFEQMAKAHSTDSSAAQGGDLGWAGPGLFVPEFERVMNALPPSKLSEPFTSRFGVHMLEVTDRRQAPLSARDQRANVAAQLRERKAAEAYGVWLAEARGRAFVEYKNVAQ